MCGTDDCLVMFSSVPCATPENNTKDSFTTINLDHGDPTMYESYWRKIGNKCDITFNSDDSLSYFANGKSLCWFLESKLEEQIKRLHKVVGNAIVDDHYIVVGTGSSQLMQATLYALSPTDQLEPYTAITIPANHDVMLFTISKCTCHAGSRIGNISTSVFNSENLRLRFGVLLWEYGKIKIDTESVSEDEASKQGGQSNRRVKK
uniref:Alliin lyase n=1 Tax=Solanum tuberosum TaxID=4113 RepID=M1CU85_SOLTU